MSLLLLSATIVALVWSFFMNDHGSVVSIVVPFTALRLFRKNLINALLQEKDEV